MSRDQVVCVEIFDMSFRLVKYSDTNFFYLDLQSRIQYTLVLGRIVFHSHTTSWVALRLSLVLLLICKSSPHYTVAHFCRCFPVFAFLTYIIYSSLSICISSLYLPTVAPHPEIVPVDPSWLSPVLAMGMVEI